MVAEVGLSTVRAFAQPLQGVSLATGCASHFAGQSFADACGARYWRLARQTKTIKDLAGDGAIGEVSPGARATARASQEPGGLLESWGSRARGLVPVAFVLPLDSTPRVNVHDHEVWADRVLAHDLDRSGPQFCEPDELTDAEVAALVRAIRDRVLCNDRARGGPARSAESGVRGSSHRAFGPRS